MDGGGMWFGGDGLGERVDHALEQSFSLFVTLLERASPFFSVRVPSFLCELRPGLTR